MAKIVSFQKAFPFLSVKSAGGYVTDLHTGTGKFYVINGKSQTIDTTKVSGQTYAYNHCPPVNSIINKKVRAFTNARWFIEDADGKVVKPGRDLYLAKLMIRPNPLQTWREFSAMGQVMLQVYGRTYIFALSPDNDPQHARIMWVLPNWIVEENRTGKYFYQSAAEEILPSYKITLNGHNTDLPFNSILKINDVSTAIGVDNDIKTIASGQSRLYPLKYVVSNTIRAYEARNVLITKRGALGILSNESKDAISSIPMTPDEKTALQNEFQNYGLQSDDWQVIITNASLKWQQMTLPTKDLLLFEEVQEGWRSVADAYDFPMALLGYQTGNSLSNGGDQDAAARRLYRDAIIPEAELFGQSFADFFKLSESGLCLRPYFDHMELLQKSEKEKFEAFKIMNEAYKVAVDSGALPLDDWKAAIQNYL